jgi:hypothetical protein
MAVPSVEVLGAWGGEPDLNEHCGKRDQECSRCDERSRQTANEKKTYLYAS